jgi:predicted dehydrogenase
MALPTPRILDPSAVPSLRWGILGAGDIARTWAATVRTNSTQRLHVVGSQTPGKAAAFAADFDIPWAVDSYEAVVTRDDVDAVYIANWPNHHAEAARAALAAGKPVLLEKPLTEDVAEAEALFAFARERGLLLMEAMWTRYIPQMDVLRQLLDDGALGTPLLTQSSFCQDTRSVARMWTKGNGSPLWDMGIYPIAFNQMVLGEPSGVSAWGLLNDEGMDLESTSLLTYDSGARATFTASGIIDLPVIATIAGTDGVVVIDPPFFLPTRIGFGRQGFNAPLEYWTDESSIRAHAALVYQVTAFSDYLARGLLESPWQSHADSLACLRVASAITSAIGARV